MNRLILILVVLSGCELTQHVPYDTSNATARLPVVLVSLPSELNPELNRKHMHERVLQAVTDHPDVRLVAFGEASLGWYWKSFDGTYQRTIAEPLDGTTVTLMKHLAVEHHLFIAFGFAELDGEKLFDSAVVIDDRGEVIAHRRKSNFVPMDEWSGFTRGDQTMTVTTLDGIKTVLLICNDYNDATYQAAVKADPEIKVVLLPQASAGLLPDTVRTHSYAYEGAWLLAPQRLGTEQNERYHGSWALDPNGFMVDDTETSGTDVYVVVATDAVLQ